MSEFLITLALIFLMIGIVAPITATIICTLPKKFAANIPQHPYKRHLCGWILELGKSLRQ